MGNDKLLPHNLQAERAVLGSILLEPRSIFTALETLASDDFYLDGHRIIFAQLELMTSDSSAIDPIVLIEELRRSGKLDLAGGPVTVSELSDGIPRGISLPHYCKIVAEKSKLRKLIRLGNQLQIDAGQDEASSAVISARVTSEILALDSSSSTFKPFSEISIAGYKRLEERAELGRMPGAIKSNLRCLDRITGGFAPGSLVLIAARPSQGKSALCAGIAIEAALYQQKRVAVLSLEMTQYEVYDRMIAYEGKIDLFKLSSGNLQGEWKKIGDHSSSLSKAKLWIDDSGSLNVRQVQARAERMKSEHKIDLFIVDYLGLMRGTQPSQKKVQEVSEISAGLKNIAKSLKIPVIAACQLNRASEDRAGGEPCLSDLRDSGSLEQDADVVILIHRQDISPDLCVRTNLIVAKNRNGRTGRGESLFHREWTRFVDPVGEAKWINPNITNT
jgi:replicative DNA helicase